MNIAVGIPTYNEADNIKFLTKKIDHSLSTRAINGLIINADNASPDGTRHHFINTKTSNKKISLTTMCPGKGRNVRAIVNMAVEQGVDALILFDGDLTSFEGSWLDKYLHSFKAGTDYVVPNYGRSKYEGNTTNQFVYPLLRAFFGSRAPRQPIAGDFGLSRRFLHKLAQSEWSNAAQSYGIDIFLTIRALTDGFVIQEINLSQKLHKPSFGKMTNMFNEVAESFFENINTAIYTPTLHDSTLVSKALLDCAPISESDLQKRHNVALLLLKENQQYGRDVINLNQSEIGSGLDITTWAMVLREHCARRYEITPRDLAHSLVPYYLLRVVFVQRELAHLDGFAAEKLILRYADVIRTWVLPVLNPPR